MWSLLILLVVYYSRSGLTDFPRIEATCEPADTLSNFVSTIFCANSIGLTSKRQRAPTSGAMRSRNTLGTNDPSRAPLSNASCCIGVRGRGTMPRKQLYARCSRVDSKYCEPVNTRRCASSSSQYGSGDCTKGIVSSSMRNSMFCPSRTRAANMCSRVTPVFLRYSGTSSLASY